MRRAWLLLAGAVLLVLARKTIEAGRRAEARANRQAMRTAAVMGVRG